MMLSLVRPTSGVISMFGYNIRTHRRQVLSNIGALIERPDFYDYLPAKKNLEIFGTLSQTPNLNYRIDETLELVGLKDRAKSKVKTYSQGMKQRLGIAQALLHQPKMIILDEPANGLDPQGLKEMRELIKTINKDKKITIFTFESYPQRNRRNGQPDGDYK
ncbi:MAG: ATP-binding cassette domain-containing protein [Bacteroidales bacterium]|nr:ATP-binding cassette domain-containing protein [Bacteroidales bacterium]